MPDDQSEDAVDPRAAAALQRLRDEPGPPGVPTSFEAFDRPRWSDSVRVAVEDRWSALVGRPHAGVLAVVAMVAVLVAAGVWIMATGTDGLDAGGEDAFRLPFTTTTGGTVPSGAVGAGPSAGAGGLTTLSALVVHAAGAVQQPGVHRVPNGARVTDVLAAAGGPTPDADVDRLNLAAVVSDGQRLYVPRVGEVAPPAAVAPDGSGAASSSAGPGGGLPVPIDLNQATEAELDELPGVGPSTAAAIVAHRVASGPFRRVDDLLDVRGIGPAKLEAMRDLVRVG